MHTFTVLYLVFFFQISLHADSAEGESLETHPETENMTFIHFLMFTLSCLRLLLVQFPATSANLTISPWLLFECVCVCVCVCVSVCVRSAHTHMLSSAARLSLPVRESVLTAVCMSVTGSTERAREGARERGRETERDRAGADRYEPEQAASLSRILQRMHYNSASHWRKLHA